MPERRPRPNVSREQGRRRVVEGSASVISDENYRYQFGTVEEARAYVRSTGLYETPEMWAIVLVPPVGADPLRLTPRRGSLAELSADQRRRYRRSRLANQEAEMRGLTLDEWYQVAPDVRSFRGHAPERQHRPGESEIHWESRLMQSDFAVYISRTSDGMSPGRKGWMSRRTRRAAGRRAA